MGTGCNYGGKYLISLLVERRVSALSHASSNNGPEVAIRSDSSNLPLLAICTSVDPWTIEYSRISLASS